MPMDPKKMSQTALNSDVAGAALYTRIALLRVQFILRKLGEKNGLDIAEDLAAIESANKDLETLFRELTGFSKDG